MQPNQTISDKEVFIKMAFSNWELQISRFNSLLDKLSDETLLRETALGRNTGAYILGHLAAVSDGIFTFLGLGERLYPELDELFLRNPENSGLQKPPVSVLREYWKTVNTELAERVKQLPAEEWFKGHTAISEENFAKDPYRNKLNIIINRTNHLSYHLGQLIYLDQK